MQSRLIHIEMEPSFEDWLKDVAIKEDYDERIIAFLNMNPNKLMDFTPDHEGATFCCPRTWEFVNKIIKDKKDISYLDKLLAGTISQGVAFEFIQFAHIFKSLITLDEIIKDPKNVEIPNDLATRWALISSLANKTNKGNISKVKIFLDRLDESFQVLFYRMLLTKNPSLRIHPCLVEATKTLYKFLYE